MQVQVSRYCWVSDADFGYDSQLRPASATQGSRRQRAWQHMPQRPYQRACSRRGAQQPQRRQIQRW